MVNTGISIAATLFLGLFYSWTRRLNGIFFFGRTLSQELRDTATAGAITSQYRTSILGLTLASLAITLFGGLHHVRVGLAGPMFLILGFGLVFARANRRARELGASLPTGPAAATVQVPILDPPSYRIPGWGATVLPLEVTLAAFGLCLLFTPHQPGLGNAWVAFNQDVERSHADFLLGMGSGMLSAATVLLGLLKTSARLRTRMAQYSIRASVALQWVGAVLLFALLAFVYDGVAIPENAGRAATLVGVLLVVVLTLWNQKRSAQFIPPAAELGADDRWRWGLFYVDREDPALFVQSRCGAGYGLNYGRVLAWPIALALVAYFISMLFLFPLHR